MNFLQRAVKAAKKLPKPLWIAAVVLPGGFIAVGIYLASKAAYKNLKVKK